MTSFERLPPRLSVPLPSTWPVWFASSGVTCASPSKAAPKGPSLIDTLPW